MLSCLASGCGPEPEHAPADTVPARPNPFLEDHANHGKEDSAYHNPDGVEAEVDIEGEIDAPAQDRTRGPALLVQFAQTFLRSQRVMYLQSLSDVAGSPSRIEWLVDGEWLSSSKVRDVDESKLRHFRIRAVNAVLLHDNAAAARQGAVYQAAVPLRPLSLFNEVGGACADPNSHVTLDQGVYWYLWNPSRPDCTAASQNLTLTIARLTSTSATTYPEYDQLIEDGTVTAVMLFGRIDDGAPEDSEPGALSFTRTATWLKEAGFVELSDAPVGLRFHKPLGDVDLQVDLYSPDDFAGLADYANWLNFDTAVTQHEVVIYQGHSLLGASNMWASEQYPTTYQIFLQGGCLGYEYYVTPVLKAKGGWDKLDIVSSVDPVPADESPGAAFLAKLSWSLDHGYAASWRDLLGAVRNSLGTSAFGVSGVRDNCFNPSGVSCHGSVAPATSMRYENDAVVSIPDGDEAGTISPLHVPESFVAETVTVVLDVSHESISDLTFSLEHDGSQVVFWDGESDGEILRDSFTLDAFASTEVQGTWTLHVKDNWELYTGRVNSWALVLER